MQVWELAQPAYGEGVLDATDTMTLWHLLLLICITTTFFTSLAVPWRANYGLSGYGIAIIVGFVVSAFFGWTMWTTHKAVAQRFENSPHPNDDWFAYGLYVIKIVWILLSGFVGFWLTSWLIRAVL